MTKKNNIETILDELESRYEASVGRLRKALTQYAENGIRPDPDERDDGAFAYPELRVEYDPETPPPHHRHRHAKKPPAHDTWGGWP